MDPESFIYRCRFHLFRLLLAGVIALNSFGVLHHKNDNRDNNTGICIVNIQPASHRHISHPVSHPAKKTPFLKPDQERLYSFYAKRTQDLFNNIIIEAANRYHVDPALVKAIIMVESSYNPRAISRKGAIGLMQLMPTTARAMGVEDSFNPENNINAGVKYLKKLLIQFNNDLRLALAAYNAGSRKVKIYQDIPPFKATKCYVEKVLAYYNHYKMVMTTELDSA